ncbi:4Fe-4S binding protein [uncultured Megamonas sp.]|uniref:4Fe-4S binding protein n=1 Tax=uncultured Megamonas sp. TaxID=286140 RepID=UPI00266FCF24|nr:4Fe-4S binding protein [uncultured Megamonas sp.]
MDIDKVYNIFFSPTDSTKFVLQFLSEQISPKYTNINLTSRSMKTDDFILNKSDLVFLGVPSYAGRVPTTFKERFSKINGNNALAVIVVTFGNRAQEDTLIELFDLAKAQGFRILAGSAIVTEHSIIHDFGKGRPDKKDKSELITFVQKIKNKLQDDVLLVDEIPGNRPYKEVKAVPMAPDFVKENCVACGRCASECPTGAIDDKTYKCNSEKCISCLRCVKVCPINCRFVDNKILEKLRVHLTPLCSERKNNQFYL